MPKYTIDDEEVDLSTLMAKIGAVPKERLDTQIKARKEAEAALDTASAIDGEHKKALKRIAELEGETGALRTSADLAKIGITDEAVIKGVRSVYNAEMDGVEKPPSLAEWLAGGGKTHPMVKAVLPAARTEGAADPAKLRGTVVSPNAGATGTGAGSTVKMTPAQVAAYLKSPEWRAKVAGKSPAEREAALTALEAEVATGAGANSGTP